MIKNQMDYLVGIDIGTTKICAIVGGYNSSDQFEVKGVAATTSQGMRKGVVVNIEQTIESIKKTVHKIEKKCGYKIKSANVAIAGAHIYSFNSYGVVSIRGHEASLSDVKRVIESSKNFTLPREREIIHAIPKKFKVDEIDNIKDPVGMCGKRLEAEVHIVTGKVMAIQNIVKCIEDSHINIENIILQPIASSESVLENEEKELGVMLVDIGGGTTDLAFWKNGTLVHSQVIPIGGNHFTNDLSVAFNIPFGEAENIKIEYGSVITENINNSSFIALKGMSGTREREIEHYKIVQVLKARSEELLSIIDKVIVDKNLKKDIVGGVVFTGGGSLINNFAVLAEFALEIPVKIGYPVPFTNMNQNFCFPQFATVMGLLNMSAKQRKKIKTDLPKTRDLISKLNESLKNIFREIF